MGPMISGSIRESVCSNEMLFTIIAVLSLNVLQLDTLPIQILYELLLAL